jgi:DNA-binding NtrC family response regulator
VRRTHAAKDTRPRFTVLSVSPIPEDHAFLRQSLFGSSIEFLDSQWSLSANSTLAEGLQASCEQRVGVVVCESDLAPGTWRDMLEHLQHLPEAPLLIVTTRLADDNLWAEALNLGAYDVLAKPFDAEELLRVVNSARLQWQERKVSAGGRELARSATASV